MIAKYGSFEYALADHYRFEAELGRGAMGTVYRARDLRLDRAVAIKMLHATLTNDLGIARFQSEIRIAASLHHPSIVAIHDSGEADGRLFYVMDYLAGETLRTRLQREKQLPVEDALSIAEQIAGALQFAHDRGVVHRDIKPENILLADGRARVVDFGLARALGDVDAERLTASGLSVGTPQYLSPEQAAAEREVGPRADQYGLACVVYEMLAGEPPFTGPTATAVAMKHISEVPAALSKRRRTTPMVVEVCVMRALEKVPADRFGTVREFAAALRAPEPAVASVGAGNGGSASALATPRRKRLALPYVIGAGVLTVALIGMIGAAVVRLDDPIDDGFRWLTNRQLDTARYAVLPFVSTVSGVGSGLEEKVRDALARWDGVSVAGGPEMESAAGGRAATVVTASDGRAIARALGAGRYVMGEVTTDGGSVRIRAEALDATGRTRPKLVSLALPVSDRITDSVTAHIAYELLYDGAEASKDEDAALGTQSRAAFEQYLRGRAAMREWNLLAADSALTAALRFDGAFPQASLALAQVRSWMSDDSPEAADLVARAVQRSTGLSPNDRAQALALSDLMSVRLPAACARFESIVKRDSVDFATWYGIAECNRRDRTVIVDPKSPTGHRFRGSQHRADVALHRAFALVPSVNGCCEARADQILRRVLLTSTTQIHFGRGIAPDTTLYGAYPQLVADTIALFPRPMDELTSGPPASNPAAVAEQQREFFGIATKRNFQFPNEPGALEELGEAMELLGYPTAVDTVRRARTLARTPNEKTRLAVYEVWLRLKLAVPNNGAEMKSLRVFAESLLTHAPPESGGERFGLASAAALLGNAPMAAKLSRQVNVQADSGFPPDVRADGAALLAYAAIGASVDSMAELSRRLDHSIVNGVLEPRQSMARTMYLGRALRLAFPAYRSPELDRVDASDELVAAEAAFAHGNHAVVRRILTNASRGRATVRPADRTLDALYPEAWLWAAIGDTTAALATISPTLDALPSIPASALSSAAAAGSLVQAMCLRALLLAGQRNYAESRRWANAVVSLTDPALVRLTTMRRSVSDLIARRR